MSSSKNWRNWSLVTNPSIISYVIILSGVRMGRIKYCCPQIKHFCWTHLVPHNDQPHLHAEVHSFFTASSPNINMFGFSTKSAIQFIKIAPCSIFCSSAQPETSLFERCKQQKVCISVEIDICVPCHVRSCSWISLTYIVGCFNISDLMKLISTETRFLCWPHLQVFGL